MATLFAISNKSSIILQFFYHNMQSSFKEGNASPMTTVPLQLPTMLCAFKFSLEILSSA
jgi:hypothetical protein